MEAELDQRCRNRFFFPPCLHKSLTQTLLQYLHVGDNLSCREICHWLERKVEEKRSWKTSIFTNDRIFITNTFKKRLHLLDH